MAVILGIDIGTSSTKAMLFDTSGEIIAVEAKGYDVDIPEKNYAEQSPDMWWDATKEILNRLKAKHPESYRAVEAVGYSGQMHGLVTVDAKGTPIRPAIIWLDQRSGAQLAKIEEQIGMEKIAQVLHNRVFTGFAFPSLLWIKEHEPERFEKIHKILLPKDYVRFKMTGELGTDASDGASSTGFAVGERDWAWDIIESLGLPADIFPECHESLEIAGKITKECAALTGLPEGIPVVYGSGDQPAYIIGTGVVGPGVVVSNVGTGGQLSVYSAKDVYDPKLRIQTFCHAVDKAYSVFGAHVCSGISLKWLRNQVLDMKETSFDEMNKMVEETEAGSEGLLYLPYLSGCRSPEMDPMAKGMFFGMMLKHEKRHFIRSVMEGVVFDFRRSQDIFEELGITSSKIIACGGGAQSPIWLQIQADILNRDVQVCKVKEQACLGACIMAGVGAGILDSVESACRQYVEMEDKIYHPIPEHVERYSGLYEIYKKLYETNKELFYY